MPMTSSIIKLWTIKAAGFSVHHSRTAVETESVKKQYVKISDAYGCLGVLNFSGGDEPNLFLILVTGCLSVGKVNDTDIFRITATACMSLQNSPREEEAIAELRKFLNSGSFYFSWSSSAAKFDLSLCAQRYMSTTQTTDNRFFWNRSLHLHLMRYNVNCNDWLLKIMCGGVEIRTIYAAQRQGKACLISRLSNERAGTRFNVRGANDFGHVANFVETEQVIYIDDHVCSFIQTRGSVPLFWEQPGIQVGSHKVKMSRGFEASAPAFDRHIILQKQQYGQQVIVNLLGRKEGEHNLGEAFQKHHKASSHNQDVPYIAFDYHASHKNISRLKDSLKKSYEDFSFFHSSEAGITRQQTGTIRTNCLDCLDRTNAVQNMIALEVLPEQLECLGLSGPGKMQMISRFVEVYKQMWQLNGDHISRIYAGTGAIGGGRSKAKDAATSATRTIQNNFLDSSKQDAIDLLLFGSGMRTDLRDKAQTLLDASCMYMSADVMRPLIQAYSEYSNQTKLRVSVGTWNVNGGKHFRSIAFKHEHIHDWLLDLPRVTMENSPEMIEPDINFEEPIDIFALGFEEIVDLNASNIVSASTTNQKEWGIYLQQNLSRDNKYILLNTQQLVGVCLYIFVRPMLAPHIRDVATVAVKTGLGGAAGNKGAIAIRFLVYNTSMCFVCSHFAAGQSNVKERNNDFHEIANRIAFPMGRKVWHHDYLFWCGDFNYRIDLSKDEVMSLIQDKNWGALQEYDQLNVQRKGGQVFHGFNEGPTNFIPTYKYDLFCNDFDTSEKCRIPAWTDRVLWRRKAISTAVTKESTEEAVYQGRLLLYNRAELKTSDHRPVMAIIETEVLQCNEERRNATLRRIIDQLGPTDGTIVLELESGEEFTDELVEEIVDVYGDVGEIILVRFVNASMLLTYRLGQSALTAVEVQSIRTIAGQSLRVTLLTPDWRQHVEDELSLTRSNTMAMYSATTHSLLGEDFSIPSMSFDMDDYDDDEVSEFLESDSLELNTDNLTISGRRSPMVRGMRSSPSPTPPKPDSQTAHLDRSPSHSPARPRPPPSPKLMPHSPGHHSSATRPAVSPVSPSVEPDSSIGSNDSAEAAIVVNDVEFGFEKNEKPKPPRPAALPSRPPPPSRPAPPATGLTAGGLSRPVCTPSPTAPSVGLPKNIPPPTTSTRQPMRPYVNPSTKKSHRQKIRHIGMPTAVTHSVHAKTAEEARMLIEQLIAGSNEKPLPPVTVAVARNLGSAPVPVPRPTAGPTVAVDPSRPAPPRPKAMPRTKSALDVSNGDLNVEQTQSMARNQSETNLQGRDSESTETEEQPLSSPVRCPSLPMLCRNESREASFETSEAFEARSESMPPQNLPPSLPPGYGRGPPPPVPCARPVGSLPAPVPSARPGLDSGAPPIPGPRPPPVGAAPPNGFQVDLHQSPNGETSGVQVDVAIAETPFVPPRPKQSPPGALSQMMPSSQPAPPVVPARNIPPPIPSRTPVGAPVIPPRQ